MQNPDSAVPTSLIFDNIYYDENPTVAPEEIINKIEATDASNTLTYISLTEELEHVIGATVKTTVDEAIKKAVHTSIPTIIQSAVERSMKQSFQEGFAQLAALMEMQKPTGSAVQSSVLAYAEKHVLIRDEKDLNEWNIRLANREIFECYAD
ncbi:uncharacterized protein LOC129721412 isoform X1 [Wyeomyia smithii]|uniref:uncharacterized protein LOC129721412 isoform X1 n=1 Tax=Wyeomyia smithii TaxID=174621 RepID=UPI002467FCD5|nr:uncharacterized protein LOC129721412 isoform X1 [Wyeomyia smithii]